MGLLAGGDPPILVGGRRRVQGAIGGSVRGCVHACPSQYGVLQVPFEELPVGIPGQGRNDVDPARALVGGQVLVTPGEQVGLDSPPDRLGQLDHALDRLAELVVGDAEHGGVQDGRVGGQHLLGLAVGRC